MEWTLGGPLGDEKRCVGDDDIGEWRVSTVFIGIDMTPSFLPADSPPRIFETMVFGPDDLAVIGRPSTWAEAEALHVATVAAVREQLKGK
jgi:hypothetical protein